jgi:hypothetical protein
VLAVDRTTTGAAGFGAITGYSSVPDGPATLAVRPAGGGTALIRKRATLEGRYTAVAWRHGGKLALDLYPEGAARGGIARLRAIHAAGEVGNASVSVDGKVLDPSLGAGQTTGYRDVPPGTHTLSIGRPGGGGKPLLSRSGVQLTAGVATTAIVIGSGGEPARMLLATDSTTAPARAPHTGLGGLSGTPWLAVLAAALGGAAIGAGGWRLARRRAA